MCEEETRVVQMHPVEKAAAALSGPIDDSVSCVLAVDAVVLCYGVVSSGAMGRYVSVGNVSGGGDIELCVVDTVLSGAVSGGLRDRDRVSEGCDTDVSGVDTVVSGAVRCCQCIYLLLLLACAITHQSHVQGTVLQPCPRHNVQVNESLDPLRRAVDGTASTSDVFCRLFGTTITTVTSRQSPAHHVCSKSTDPSP